MPSKVRQSGADKRKLKTKRTAAQKEIRTKKKDLKENKKKNANDGVQVSKNAFAFDKSLRKKAKTTVKSIPYKKMHPNGILELRNGRYSKTFMISDINYMSARDDEREAVFAGFVGWLNSLSPHILAQITIINQPVEKDALAKAVLIPEEREPIVDTITGVNLTREYNEILTGFLSKSTHNYKRDKYISITVSEFDFDAALRHLIDIEALMRQKFKSIAPECKVHPVEGDEKIKLLAQIFRGKDIPSKTFDASEIDASAEKAYIAPDSIKFMSHHLIIDENRYGRCIFVRDLPADHTDELINAILSTQIEMMITVNIKPIDITKAKKKIQEKVLIFQEKLLNRQEKMISKNNFSDAERSMPKPFKDGFKALEETDEAVNEKKQKLFSFNMVILVWGDDLDDLAFKTSMIKAKADEMVVDLGVLNYQQEIALQSVLPIGFNNLSIKRTIPSEAMALFTPFDRLPTIQEGGFFYSLHAETSQPVVINNNKLKSPSGFILGSSGSGKGMFIKPIITYILMSTDDDVILIDPENENKRLVTALGGQVIELSSISRDFINPFDIPLDDEDFAENGITANELKLDLILSIISTMTSNIDKEIIRSVVDGILKVVYTPFQKSKDPKDIPTFKDFYDELIKFDGEIENWLANVLKIFVHGSWDIFSNMTNVETSNRFICYDTSRLGENLKAVSSFIMFDAIWNRITKNRNTGRKTWIFVDEAHLVFKNPDEIAKVEAMYRRIRKYDGRIYSITQNTADLLRWEAAQTMLQNSDFIAILNQKKIDRDKIQEILAIPDAVMPSITNSGKGEGLIFAQDMIIPFANLFPNKTRLYELMTTDSEELAVILAKEADMKMKGQNI